MTLFPKFGIIMLQGAPISKLLRLPAPTCLQVKSPSKASKPTWREKTSNSRIRYSNSK